MIFIHKEKSFDCEFQVFDWDDDMPLMELVSAECEAVMYSRESLEDMDMPVEQWEQEAEASDLGDQAREDRLSSAIDRACDEMRGH